MEFLEELYVGETVENIGTIVYSLRREIPVFRLYCIVLFCDRNRIEILSSKELFTKKNKNRQKILTGIAMGRQEAISLFAFMLENMAKTGKDLTNPSAWFVKSKEGASL